MITKEVVEIARQQLVFGSTRKERVTIILMKTQPLILMLYTKTQCEYQSSKNKVTEEVNYQISRRIFHVATTGKKIGQGPAPPCAPTRSASTIFYLPDVIDHMPRHAPDRVAGVPSPRNQGFAVRGLAFSRSSDNESADHSGSLYMIRSSFLLQLTTNKTTLPTP